MARLIEIHDKRAAYGSHFLAFDLVDLLRLVAPEGRDLAWGAFGLDVVGTITISHAPWEGQTVTPVSYAKLLEWSTGITQVIWGIFVGGSEQQLRGVRPAMDNADLYRRCPLVIEAFDSTFWRVFARDDAVVERVSRAFADVRERPVPVSEDAAPDEH